jgi:magnesium transporter
MSNENSKNIPMSNNHSKSIDDRNNRKSIGSTFSSDQSQGLIQHHNEDVIDAMGLMTEDSSSISPANISRDNMVFNDHRKFSDIHPDQKIMRPKKQYRDKPKDAFSQQSQLLSHSKDRYGLQNTEPGYGTIYNNNNNNNNNNNYSKYPIPITTAANNDITLNNPFLPNKKYTAQKSLLSQSMPISTISDNYLSTSPKDENSLYASSNPSSRRSSAASSLNDVCFPVDSLNEVDRSKQWPNLALLEEFVKEEIDDLKKIRSSSISQRSFTPDIDNEDETDNVNFQYPIVSNVDYDDLTEPLLVPKRDEIDPINGRLRPKKMTPWNKPAFVTHHDKLTNFRFTYFRPDIPETIHSPTLAGLLHGGRTFKDLFSSDHYTSSSTDLTDDKESNDVKIHKSATNSSLSPHPANSTTNHETSTNKSKSLLKPFVQPFWLDILNPTEEEMKTISKTFGIHPLTSEDIFLGEAREKVELFRDYYFVCFTSFDVQEEHQRRKKAAEKAFAVAIEEEQQRFKNDRSIFEKVLDTMKRRQSTSSIHSNSSRKSKKSIDHKKSNASLISRKGKKKKHNKDELIPLTMYIVVFKDGVITFHFKPTPHTGNVRRRARLLRDYLTVSSDWVGYALIDDITDAFGPLIEAIESEVNLIEDEIISMQSGDHSDNDSDSDSDDENDDPVWIKVKRRNSNITGDKDSLYTRSSISTNSSSEDTKIISWKKKGDMLRRIGDCRRRVMSMLRFLGSKADVIKGFSKRYNNEQWEVAPRTEIGLYLGDIQDHIVTMVQNLNHYEKLLARSHSNYLAQINIDMTKVNNDMNEILGKLTVLGTIVLPLNIVTGLWGMNCLVPGQDVDNLQWFWMIITGMVIFALSCYYYVKKLMNIV